MTDPRSIAGIPATKDHAPGLALAASAVLVVLLLTGLLPGVPTAPVASASPVMPSHAILLHPIPLPTSSRPWASAPGLASPTLTVRVSAILSGGSPPAMALPSIPAAPANSLIANATHGLRSSAVLPANGPAASNASLHLQFITEGLSATSAGGGTPPDVQIASGPSQEVEFVNVYGQAFNLTGHSLGSFFLGSFFGTGRDYLSDPKILYDNESGRWFASILRINQTTGNCFNELAVSSSADALGNWTVYTLADPTGGALGDQPILGISSKLIAISVNLFAGSTGPSGVEFWVVNKSSAMGGGPIAYVSYGPLLTADSSIHPVQGVSPNDTLYMVEAGPASTQLRLIEVDGVPPANLTFVNTSLSILPVTPAPSGVQPGTSKVVDTGDQRIQSAVWDHGVLWLAFNDQCTPSGDTQSRACFRMVEVDTVNSTVVEDFDVGSSGAYLYYPALALNGRGDLTVVYGESSSSIYPSILVTGRLLIDTPGTLRPAAVLRAGTTAITGGCAGGVVCRYGDYFGAGQSPGNSTAWVAGEYNGQTSEWQTSFALASNPVPPVTEVRLRASTLTLDAGQSSTVTFSLLNSTCLNATGDHCRVFLPLLSAPFSANCVSPFSGLTRTLAFPTAGSFTLGSGGYVAVFASATCAGSPSQNLSVTRITVQVHPPPSVQIVPSPGFPLELSEVVTLRANVTGGSGVSSYLWSSLPAGCSNSRLATVTCAPTRTGSGTLSVNVSDQAGVTANASLAYLVLPNPSVSLSASPSATDVGLPVDLIATSVGGVGGMSYAWSGLPTGCLGANSAELICNAQQGGAFEVLVPVNDSAGFRANSSLVAITIYSAPTVLLRPSGPTTLVAGTNLSLSAAASGGNPPFSFGWTGLPPGCVASGAPTLTCAPTSAGTFHVIVEASDSVGGHAFAQLNITVTAPVSSSGGSGGVPIWAYEVIALVLVVGVAAALVLALRRRR